MRHRVSIEEPVTLTSPSGGTRTEWRRHSTRWAAITPLSGSELLTARQVVAEVSHQVSLWWFPELKASWRLVVQGRVLNIVSAIDVDEKHRELRLLCAEAV